MADAKTTPKICVVESSGRKEPRGDAYRWLKDRTEHTGEACLIFPHARDDKGYGILSVDGKIVRAHIIMCTLAHGPKPFPGAVARHFKCGNGFGGCCHPEHLKWGTTQQNSDDMVVHGKSTRGEKCNLTKIPEADVHMIRARLFAGEPQSAIARDYSVVPSTVSSINSGRAWGWLPPGPTLRRWASILGPFLGGRS